DTGRLQFLAHPGNAGQALFLQRVRIEFRYFLGVEQLPWHHRTHPPTLAASTPAVSGARPASAQQQSAGRKPRHHSSARSRRRRPSRSECGQATPAQLSKHVQFVSPAASRTSPASAPTTSKTKPSRTSAPTCAAYCSAAVRSRYPSVKSP